MLNNTANLFLLVFALLGYLSKNNAVTYAMLFLLIARITPLSLALPHIEKYGLRLGILILTIGVMSPIATGKVDSNALQSILTNWHAWIAIVIGIFVSWVGGQGIQLLHSQPHSITGLLRNYDWHQRF